MQINPIDPSKGFEQLKAAWTAAHDKKIDPNDPKSRNVLTHGQGYWHAGNTLDTYVTYLAQAGKRDDQGIVAESLPIFQTPPDPPDPPKKPQDIWWRDDYGWWGIAFLNAADNASTLGIENIRDDCVTAAEAGWMVMMADWEDPTHYHQGVRNDPSGQNTETNTITNVLFFMLSLRLYLRDSKKYSHALLAAEGIFDWFYPDKDKGPKRLFNNDGLVRYLPGSGDERAWSADQGWFWRAYIDLFSVTNAERKDRIVNLTGLLQPAIISKIFQNGVVREQIDGILHKNFDVDFATGPGVFLRQFAIINKDAKGAYSDLIQVVAPAA
jgi:Glycosyl hydrolase family 76